MTLRDIPRDGTAINQLIDTVAPWPAITTGNGRFKATSCQMEIEEIGHVQPGGEVDSSSPPPFRDQLIADGRTEDHHILQNSSTATTFAIASADDIDNAGWLLRLSYLHHVLGRQKHEGTGTAPELTAIDVEEKFDELDPSDAPRSAVEPTAVHRL